MKKQLLLILFSFLAVAGYARVITGTVISESDNEPVIGATVMVKGTQRGVATDFDGKFTLDVKDSDVLTITNVGMLQQDVKVGKQQSNENDFFFDNIIKKLNCKYLQFFFSMI